MTELKGSRQLSSANSPTNAISFLIDRIMAGGLNTCTLVTVTEVDKDAQRLTVLPLVPQIDGNGNTLAPQPIYDIPYSRVQGGICALIVDPVVGDNGLCVFAQRDISTVKSTRKQGQPGSMRTFDQADGVYVGWLLNKVPTVFIELGQDGKIQVVAPGGLTLDAPTTDVTGILRVAGDIQAAAQVVAQGEVTAMGTTKLHVHVHTSTAPGQPTSPPTV